MTPPSDANSPRAYNTPEIERYFRSHRKTWEGLYPSERVMLEKLAPRPDWRVLDIGCGCGGLGLILREKFGVTAYTGVEINAAAAATAREFNPGAQIIAGDFLSLPADAVRPGGYDLAVSLSCIDWNLGFDVALPRAFGYAKPGGYFLASFRLTEGATVDDSTRSYQFINFDGEREGERACYVVLNARELLGRLTALGASEISGYGYWGPPSSTAITPFHRLCFAVCVVRKAMGAGGPAPALDLQLPGDLLGR